MALEHYITKGQKRLRCGYTTGTCAALAAKAAAGMLLGGQELTEERLLTPAGLEVRAPLLKVRRTTDAVSCAVAKDAGDDIDATDGLYIYATVQRTGTPGVAVEGGVGVGRVTRPGLEQPVGAAAINATPRRMIIAEVEGVCRRLGYTGGLAVTVSVPGGEAVAAKTFNPQLGIAGGISILGTSGIVEPQSLQALVDTIEVELKMQAAAGSRRLIVVPGNYGERFLEEHPPGKTLPQVKCSNFMGETLDFAAALGFEELVLVGHIGKFVKLAAGIMNTHSRYADGRGEIFAAHAALAGAGQDCVARLLDAPTADACIALLDEQQLRRPVLKSILKKIVAHTARRAGEGVHIEIAVFSNRYGALCWTPGAGELLRLEEQP